MVSLISSSLLIGVAPLEYMMALAVATPLAPTTAAGSDTSIQSPLAGAVVIAASPSLNQPMLALLPLYWPSVGRNVTACPLTLRTLNRAAYHFPCAAVELAPRSNARISPLLIARNSAMWYE